VGGKTGVNHPAGKNLIGAFYQPLAGRRRYQYLATLPDRELRGGLAEVSSTGASGTRCCSSGWNSNIDDLTRATCGSHLRNRSSLRNQAQVVAQDERETICAPC